MCPEATQLAQQAAQLKTQTDQKATSLTNAAKSKKVNVPVVSTPVTIKITPAPITLAEMAAVTIKQGEKAETSLAITRLYDFKGQVTVSVVAQGVSGLSIPNVAIPANQLQAKLPVMAAANATEGEHQLVVRANLSLNGQNLVVEQPMRLVVQKADPK